MIYTSVYEQKDGSFKRVWIDPDSIGSFTETARGTFIQFHTGAIEVTAPFDEVMNDMHHHWESQWER